MTINSCSDKEQLRLMLKQQRRSLTVGDWHLKSEQICEHLGHFIGFQKSQTVLAYFSFYQEPDLSLLFNLTGQQTQEMGNKTWGFPRCVGRSLLWHCWAPGEPLAKSRYGTQEPLSLAPILSPETVDLILVPAVACDRRGYRLGYGAGFYDRLFADPVWAKVLKVGIVFNFALVPELPIDPWDQPLNAVCTEVGLYETHLTKPSFTEP